jgi:hypothetical protein
MKNAKSLVHKNVGYGSQYQKNQGDSRNANQQATENNQSKDKEDVDSQAETERAGNLWRSGPRNHNVICTVHTKETKVNANVSMEESNCSYEYALIDSACDTCGVGGDAWHIDSVVSGKTVSVSGYNPQETVQDNVQVGSAITAVDLPTGETVLVRVNEATMLGPQANSLLSKVQMLHFNVIVEDTAKLFGGKAFLQKDEYVFPLTLRDAMVTLKIRKPNSLELKECFLVDLTSDLPWEPTEHQEEEISSMEYDALVAEQEAIGNIAHLNVLGKGDTISKSTETHLQARTKVPRWQQYEKYFMFPGEQVMKETMKNTTMLGKFNMRLPLRQHYHSRNPLLNRH